MKVLKAILVAIYPILIALLLLLNLKACDRQNETPPQGEVTDTTEEVRQAQEVGKTGNLKVTLLWDFFGDIDLHVTQPNGYEIFYDNRTDSETGGYLDVDNVNGGNGSAENIYWEKPQKGNYSISLVYYQPSRSMNLIQSGTCTVVVFQQGKSPITYKVRMDNVRDQKHIANISIQ